MLLGRKYSYSYDARGNQEYRYLTSDKSAYWHYSWNANNQLTTAELVNSGTTLRTVSFTYDAFGRRFQKTVTMDGTTTTTSYVYDGEDIILQQTSTGTTHFVHSPGIDEPLAMVTNGTNYFYHADGLGSIVALTNASQAVVQRYSYDTFGMVTASDSSFESPYAFTGREWDEELGLYYYRARYYDPMDGRFIAKDPIGFAGGDVNVYAYVGNQPVNWVDPSGRSEYLVVYRVFSASVVIFGGSHVNGTVIATIPDESGNYPAANFSGPFVGVSLPLELGYSENIGIFTDNWESTCSVNRITGNSQMNSLSFVEYDQSIPTPSHIRFGELVLQQSGPSKGLDISIGGHFVGDIAIETRYTMPKDTYDHLMRKFNNLPSLPY